MNERIQAWALLSGGKDSLSVAAWLAERDMLAGCVSLDTGLSIPEWRDFIETTCRKQGWPLRMYAAKVGPYGSFPVYEGFVERLGFPGPGLHSTAMRWLKERALDNFRREKPGSLLASGMRLGESKRRLGSCKEWNVFAGMCVWSPLIQWTTEQTWAYFNTLGLARSPGYDVLGISGDCLCGAFARPDERDLISEFYPTVDSRLCKLEARLKEKGMKRCEWGWGNGKTKRPPSVLCVECHPTGLPKTGTR